MKGFVQIPILILLLVGTGVSIYLVQQRTHLLPRALSNISSKEIIDLFTYQPIATTSATQPFTYQLPTPSPIGQSNIPLLSSLQRIIQRTVKQSPTPVRPPKIITSPTPIITPEPFLTSLPAPTAYPSVTSNQNNSTSNTSKPKPICGVLVLPSDAGDAPYQTSICVGNNSNPYQAAQQEFTDYDGDGNWNYQGLFYGCHIFTFQYPGTYNPKAKIIGVSGEESDICQTTVVVSAADPTPTPSPSATSCSQGSLGMYIKFQDITANGPTLKYVNLSLKQPGTNNELWKFENVPASNNVSTFFNYTQGDMYRIGLGNTTCGTYDIYVSSSGYQEKKFPNIVVDNDPWNDPEVYIFYGSLIKL